MIKKIIAFVLLIPALLSVPMFLYDLVMENTEPFAEVSTRLSKYGDSSFSLSLYFGLMAIAGVVLLKDLKENGVIIKDDSKKAFPKVNTEQYNILKGQIVDVAANRLVNGDFFTIEEMVYVVLSKGYEIDLKSIGILYIKEVLISGLDTGSTLEEVMRDYVLLKE